MSPQRLQSQFFAEMADPQAFRAIFDHLPDVYFFVKDRQSRIIAASSTILERFGLKSEWDFVGTTDEQFFPADVAADYVADDRQVFATGQPMIDRLEIWFDENRRLDWCLTTKVPLRGRNGRVIGLMGVTRREQDRSGRPLPGEAAQILRFLRRRSDRIVSAAELARECGMSERTLYRKVKKSLGVTPYELILRIRIQKAAEAILKTRASLAEIALAHGFCDQSSFTHHFRKRLGITPKQFRLRHLAPG